LLLQYTPDPDKPDETREFAFKHDQMLSVEADAIERVTGLTWDEVGEQFLKGSSKVQRAVLWVFLKRENPQLKFTDLNGLRTGQLRREFDVDELRSIRDNLDRKGDELSEDDREAMENVLTAHQFEAIVKAEGEDPKASPNGSPKSPTGKPGRSPGSSEPSSSP
jgi:hypothetical protein